MVRIYHPWNLWEDYRNNFYGGVCTYDKTATLEKYAEFLKDIKLFEECLKIVTSEWIYSCEHNLTNEALNRIAYLGQASMALAYKVPHTASMGGYNLLTESEKYSADSLAEKYLNIFLERYK